ncbi:hypothetical protein [Microbulbifer spongiae]|uniref:XRE family transcriptional regulator n=1 Tax=Microbulbifer spongiae TaxID=2944933 RepID=A0ABY9EH90_9GAMM|nr:hypothetical protein [Microbulbifer sp. MI-G]WKD51707.1 hypothetical protein M8T91_18520 [Microbulbifer sp. MI-G]
MEVGDIRLENARQLSKKFNNLKEFSEALGMAPSQISQLIGPNPRRRIGTTVARRIETACSKEKGWLDVAHKEKSSTVTTESGVDIDLLVDCISAVEGKVTELKIKNMPTEARARAIATVYAYTEQSNSVEVMDPSFAIRMVYRGK